MALREGIELRFAPATHVFAGHAQVVRIDALTIEEAREVIVRLCDDLEAARQENHELKRRRRHA